MGMNRHNTGRFRWSWLGAALRNDARLLMSDTQGGASNNPKILLVSIVCILAAAAGLSALSSNGKATPKPQTLSAESTGTQTQGHLQASNLYDFRQLDDNRPVDITKDITLKPGQNLGPLLQKNGVTPAIAYQVTQSLAKVYNPRNLRAGQKLHLYFETHPHTDEAVFNGLSLKPDLRETVFVTRKDDGFVAKKIAGDFQKSLAIVSAPIENSLYLDAQALGAPDKVIVQFSQIYAHSVDFQRDIRKGDRFEMLFEVYRDHKGNPVKAGDLIYTSFSPHGKTAEYFLFEKSDGREGYYDKNGKGAKRMLMRTPINGARISSRFGYRKHPVLGYRKKHKGVDFAAPRGTPILAGGTGTITHAGRYGGYGNYIRIRHSDGYATAYGHMRKFARGIHRGSHVRQGQVIGYVGTTGRSTGPHLHYEVLKNGHQINPLRLATLTGKPLRKSEMPAFKKRVQQVLTLKTKAEPARLDVARSTGTHLAVDANHKHGPKPSDTSQTAQ